MKQDFISLVRAYSTIVFHKVMPIIRSIIEKLIVQIIMTYFVPTLMEICAGIIDEIKR